MVWKTWKSQGILLTEMCGHPVSVIQLYSLFSSELCFSIVKLFVMDSHANCDKSSVLFRDRPAAIHIEVKSIDDTSNFDDFPDVDLKWRKFCLHILSDIVVIQIC